MRSQAQYNTANLFDQADSLSTIGDLQSVLSEDMSLANVYAGAAQKNFTPSDALKMVWLQNVAMANFAEHMVGGFAKSTLSGFWNLIRHPVNTATGIATFAWESANEYMEDQYGIEAPGVHAQFMERINAMDASIGSAWLDSKADYLNGNWAGLGNKVGLFLSVVNPFGGEFRDAEVLGDFGVGAEEESLNASEHLINSNRQRTAFLRDKYSHWSPIQRQARIKELSLGNRFLREQGVPKEYISQVLQSFEPGQISLQFSDESTYGIRFYGGGSRDISPYLNPTFPLGDVRSLNALPPVNQANQIMQWQVKPSTPYLFGRIRANFGQPGGGLQMYIPDFESNLWRPNQ